MISDVGGVADFDGRKLKHTDLQTLKESDCVALTNWSANKSGNFLARKVFAINGRKDRLNFLDPSDLAGAEGRIKQLKEIIDEGLTDVISVNENETRILAKSFSTNTLPRRYTPRDVLRTSTNLQNALHVTLDVHTPIGSASTSSETQAWSRAFRPAEGFVTGAGDVWDAADILAHLLHIGLGDRLRLANACAYLYLSSGGVRLPRLVELQGFLDKK